MIDVDDSIRYDICMRTTYRHNSHAHYLHRVEIHSRLIPCGHFVPFSLLLLRSLLSIIKEHRKNAIKNVFFACFNLLHIKHVSSTWFTYIILPNKKRRNLPNANYCKGIPLAFFLLLISSFFLFFNEFPAWLAQPNVSLAFI